MRIDDQEQCYEYRHLLFCFVVAIPTLILFLLILPAIPLVLLMKVKNKQELQTNRKLIFRYGLLFSGYSTEKWYWEIVVLSRKVLIIIIVTFLNSSTLQLHCALICFVLMLYLQERGRPFEEKHDRIFMEDDATLSDAVRLEGLTMRTEKYKKEHATNHLLHLTEVSSLLVLLCMTWIGLFFSLTSCGIRENDCTTDIVLSVMIIAANIVFVLICAFVGLKKCGEKFEVESKLQNLRGRARSTFENIVDHTNLWNRRGEVKSTDQVEIEMSVTNQDKKKRMLGSRLSSLEFFSKKSVVNTGGEVKTSENGVVVVAGVEENQNDTEITDVVTTNPLNPKQRARRKRKKGQTAVQDNDAVSRQVGDEIVTIKEREGEWGKVCEKLYGK